MRGVNKSAVARPARLRPDSIAFQHELTENRDAIAKGGVGKSFSLYKSDEVRFALESLFHGKCAYCESNYSKSQPVDLEHFRPKGRVAEDKSHPGYWWLAADWDNLLPSCIDCNRARKHDSLTLDDLKKIIEGKSLDFLSRAERTRSTQGKASSFPIADENNRCHTPDGAFRLTDEQPLLITPCEADYKFENYFRYDFSRRREWGVLVLPKTQVAGEDEDFATHRALQSILTYGLNRLRLRQARERALVEVDYLVLLILRHIGFLPDIDPDSKSGSFVEENLQILTEFLTFKVAPEAEFSQMVLCYLDHRFQKALGLGQSDTLMSDLLDPAPPKIR